MKTTIRLSKVVILGMCIALCTGVMVTQVQAQLTLTLSATPTSVKVGQSVSVQRELTDWEAGFWPWICLFYLVLRWSRAN